MIVPLGVNQLESLNVLGVLLGEMWVFRDGNPTQGSVEFIHEALGTGRIWSFSSLGHAKVCFQ